MHDNQSQAILFSYLAGIMDGEGCMRVTKSLTRKHRNGSPVYTAELTVQMTDKKIPYLFFETFKLGSIWKREYSPADKNRNSMYRWRVTSRHHTKFVLESLLPYLIVKKAHAIFIIDFVNQWVNTPKEMARLVNPREIQRREEAYQISRKFNAVGAGATTEREGAERLSDSLNSWETMRGELKYSPAIN